MKRRLVIVSLMGAAGVALGAVGAHSLRPYLTDVAFNSYETGVRYLFIHTLLLAAIALHGRDDRFMWTFRLIATGTLMFSGSIFVLSTRALHGVAAVSVLGPVTPLGGLLLIAGWLALALESRNLNSKE